jgi:anti-sigma-K factor RskA
MREEHITDILDGGRLAGLGGAELERVREHAGRCAACARAYAAARASSAMLAESAARPFEPPPFFQTRVLAALRERQAAEQSWSFARLWKTAGALVSSMAVTVAALAALTFLAPDSQQPSAPQEVASVYTADDLVFGLDGDEEMTDEQVLDSIYEPAEGAAQ